MTSLSRSDFAVARYGSSTPHRALPPWCLAHLRATLQQVDTAAWLSEDSCDRGTGSSHLHHTHSSLALFGWQLWHSCGAFVPPWMCDIPSKLFLYPSCTCSCGCSPVTCFSLSYSQVFFPLVYVCVCVCVCACVCACVYACMDVMYAYRLCLYISMCVCACMRVHVCDELWLNMHSSC